MAFSVTPCPPVGTSDNLYSLKWNHYQSCLTSGLAGLLDEEYSMTDVTLACEGEFIQAHKIALAVSSPFFKTFFKMNRVEKAGITLIALANVKFKDLKNIIQFIYHGEISVKHEEISSFLKAANLLQIQGLLGKIHETNQSGQDQTPTKFNSSNFTPTPTPPLVIPNALSSSQTICRAPVDVDPVIPVKRSRLSVSASCSSSVISAPQMEARIPTPVSNVPLPPSSLAEYSLMHNENEEDEEEMINMDMKQEPITVFSLSDTMQEFEDGDTNTRTVESEDDDSSGLRFHDFSFSDQLLNQTSEPGPSGTSGPGRTIKPSRSNSTAMRRRNSPNITFTVPPNDSAQHQEGVHGMGGIYFDSRHQTSRVSCLCGTTFSQKASLRRHITEIGITHTIKCEPCGKLFYRERNLQRHQRQSKTCSLVTTPTQDEVEVKLNLT